MYKRGELTSAQIIGLVLTIAAVAVIFALIYGFKDSVTADDDICKISVVGRATASGVVGGAGQFVPLQCTTKKICVTDKLFGGSCSQFIGEKDVMMVRLKGTNEEKASQLEEVSANAMYSCWNQMGQGKLDTVSTAKSQLGWDSSKSTCVVCSRLAIDNGISADVLSKIDLNTYLSTHKVPGSSLTYLQTFTDAGVSSFPTVSKESFNLGLTSKNQETLDSLKKKMDDASAKYTQAKLDSSSTQENIDSLKADYESARSLYEGVNAAAQSKLNRNYARNEIALVFMQIKPKSLGDVLNNQITLGAAVAGGAFAFAPSQSMRAASTAFSAVRWTAGLIGAGWTVVGALGIAGADVAYSGLNTFESQTAAAGYCGDLTSAEKAQKGCSIVQLMPYSVDDITNLCQIIQGNP